MASPATNPNDSATVAAIDLGSNSFHLIVAQLSHGRIQILDRIKEMVRLASGLDESGKLDECSTSRALDCLERFGQRLRDLPAANVTAVGTNTLRKAADRAKFLRRAEQALGHRIEIISGREEARLVYLGVSQTFESDDKKRLVVDIGGGSTELIIGSQKTPEEAESLHMGCVQFSERYFPDGKVTQKNWEQARLAAAQELEPLRHQFRYGAWELAYGSSGTIRTIGTICTHLGNEEGVITAETLRRIGDRLIDSGNSNKVELSGLPSARRPVFAGGVAILSSVFNELGVERMIPSPGALREGLLHQLLGRMDHIDVREHTVAALVERYRLDRDHAAQVENTALYLLVEVAQEWQIDIEAHAPLLRWSARLHEIGLDIAHSQFHKHGAYLLNHLDMAGFTQTDQSRLAVLVRAHRRKFPMDEYERFASLERLTLIRLTALLRIATLIHRSRSDDALPLPVVRAGPDQIELDFPKGWLDEHALTRLDLEQEASYLRNADIRLLVS